VSLGQRFADKAMELIDKQIETDNHTGPSPLDMQ